MPRRARDSGSTPVNRAQHPSIINGNILFFSNVDGTIDDEYEGKYNHMVVVLTNAGGDITVALITSKEKSRHLPLKWDPNEPCPGLDLADVIEVKVVTGTPFRVDSYVSLEPFKISKKETLVPLKHGKAEARLASGQLDKLRKKIQGFKLELARGAVPKALPAPHAPIAGPSTSKSATPVPKSSTKKAGRNKKSKGQKSGVRKTGKNSGAAGESSTVVEPTPQTYSADLTTQNYPTISTARAPLDETSTTRSTTASVEPRPWASLLQPIPQNHPTNTSTRTPTTTASRQQYTTNSITQSLTPQPTRPATTTPQTPLHTSQPTQPAVATPQNPLRTSQPTRPAVATPPAPLHSAWRPNRPTAATSQTPLRTSQRNRPAAATPQTPLRRPETIHNNYTNRYNSNVERNSSYHYGSILENGRGDGIRVVGYDEDDEESSGWNLWHLGLFALGLGALFWLKRRK